VMAGTTKARHSGTGSLPASCASVKPARTIPCADRASQLRSNRSYSAFNSSQVATNLAGAIARSRLSFRAAWAWARSTAFNPAAIGGRSDRA